MIAVLVSTRDRAHVAGWTRALIDRQTVRDRVRVIVVDGSATAQQEAWDWADEYEHCPAIPLGGSRNRAIERGLAAGASYMALWDDDDYYTADHLERSVAAMEESGCAVAGASRTPMYYLSDGAVFVGGPYGEGHALEPTLVFRASYVEGEEGHRFLPYTRGLSAEFLADYSAPLVQVEGTIVVMCHRSNTYDKDQIRATPKRYLARQVWGLDVPEIVWDLADWLERRGGHPMLCGC